ncbi:MAG TPA: amino acid ABC transporter permease [Symbiobacteriaceae bacterium]|nr:amino acid ABC transporter permease [Symbiobacteriaceae bacterium]
MDWHLMLESIPLLLKGAVTTLKIAAISGSIGVFLGTVIGLGNTWGSRPLSALLRVYIEFLRGTPLYVQLLIGVFGIPAALDIQVDEFTAAVIIIGVNSSAYVAEIMRGGIQSIDKGQMEAARSMGMTHGQAMLYVILPQAFKRVIPPLVNESITLIKESSLVAAVALVELTRTAQMISSRTYKPFEVYIMSALVYLVMTLTLSNIASRLERRLKASD